MDLPETDLVQCASCRAFFPSIQLDYGDLCGGCYDRDAWEDCEAEESERERLAKLRSEA